MGARSLPTGTVTLLFTDVEGSTKLLHALGAAGYAEALADHHACSFRIGSSAEAGPMGVHNSASPRFQAKPTTSKGRP